MAMRDRSAISSGLGIQIVHIRIEQEVPVLSKLHTGTVWSMHLLQLPNADPGFGSEEHT